MSIRKWFGIKNSGNGHVIVAGSFEPDGTNDPTSVRGEGFTVTRQSTGEYRVTFDQPYQQVVSMVVTSQHSSASTDKPIVRLGTSLPASKYIDIVYLETADTSTTDMAQADTNVSTDRINFIAVLAQKNIPGAGI